MDSDMMPLDTAPAPLQPAPAPRIPPGRAPILLFVDALAALKTHSFDAPDAARAALALHVRTAEAVNLADLSTLQAARAALVPSTHFLAYVATLHAALAVVDPAAPPVPALLADWRALVANTPPEWARAAHPRWVGAARHAARLAMAPAAPHGRALSVVRPLHEAADKLATRPDALVPTQADFLAACLHARAYGQAATWVKQHRRLYADAQASGVTPSDVHLIYHYAALVLVGVKDFRSALQMCRLALAVPVPSSGSFFHVAVATFRVYVLVHLMVTGKFAPPLKFTSYPAGGMRKLASEYVELAYAVEKVDIGQARQILQSNEAVFEKHGMLGLVKQVMVSLSERAILRLADSYVTLRLADVATKAGLRDEEEVQAVLMRMTESNRLNAVIDEREKMVRLLDKEVREDERVAEQLSSANMSYCLEVVRRIEDFRHELECDPEYVRKEGNAQQQQQQRQQQQQEVDAMQPGGHRRAMGAMAHALADGNGAAFETEV